MSGRDVAVMIPTFRRPAAIAAACRSVFAQGDALARARVVVVDNCPDHSARDVLEALAREAPAPLTCVHAPAPGVANARNAAFAAASEPFALFLDDDQIAEPGWLAAILETQARLQADIVFGPQRAVAPDPEWPWAGLLADLHTRPEMGKDTLITTAHATGNCLIHRAALALPDPPFDPACNETGGEDDAFFAAALRAGAVLGWSQGAVVREEVPAARQSLRYIWRRNLAFGQTPAQDALAADPPRRLDVARHMGVGLAQLGLYGVSGLIMTVAGRPIAARHLNRALVGLGKFLWFLQPPRFYGAAAIADPDAGRPAPAR